jgi:hypothetical protein
LIKFIVGVRCLVQGKVLLLGHIESIAHFRSPVVATSFDKSMNASLIYSTNAPTITIPTTAKVT